MQDLPNGGGRTPGPKGASRVGLCGGGGGGAPIQTLAPGRWRPSVRHWIDLHEKSACVIT